jgi:hypothetical protein
VSGKLHAPAALPCGKSIRTPLDRRLSSDILDNIKEDFRKMECEDVVSFQMIHDSVEMTNFVITAKNPKGSIKVGKFL